MNAFEMNQELARGNAAKLGVLPKLDQLATETFVFNTNFGLEELPAESGVMMVRGARQYGKSTWLQSQIKKTVESYGPGSAFYLSARVLEESRSAW